MNPFSWALKDLVLLALCFALIVAAVVHLAVLVARLHRDAGVVWVRVLRTLAWALALPFIASSMIEFIDVDWWNSGWHPRADLVKGAGQSAHAIAVGVPLLTWVLALLIASWWPQREPGGLSIGALGYKPNRTWVWAFVLPFVLILWASWQGLGRGIVGYSAFGWMTVALASVCLVGAALSLPKSTATAKIVARETVVEAASGPALADWPEQMRALGLEVETLAQWKGTRGQAALDRPPAQATPFLQSATQLGLDTRIPERLSRALGSLFERGVERGQHKRCRGCLVMAPDEYGQLESIAAAATMVKQQYQELSLVVTRRGSPTIAERLQQLVAPELRIKYLAEDRSSADFDPGAPVDLWVVDAAALSDRVLPNLGASDFAAKMRLLIWWEVNAYTGVAAAHMWAISRRLDRLVRTRRNESLKAIAFARAGRRDRADLERFVTRLLPHHFDDDIVSVTQPSTADLELHRIRSHHAYIENHWPHLDSKSRQPLLLTAWASVHQNWPTHVELPEDLPSNSRGLLEEMLTGQGHGAGDTLAQALTNDVGHTRVCLVKPDERNALDFDASIARTGNAHAPGLACHVAIVEPENPYVAWRVGRLAKGQNTPEPADMQASRRLVAAESNPEIVRKHMILALQEVPTVREDLRRTFLWREDVLRSTLAQIEDSVTQHEVRRLSDDHPRKVRVDQIYRIRSTADAGTSLSSLETVTNSDKLIRVIDPGQVHQRELMLVDPVRAPIQAYPARVFTVDGRRYRIREWSQGPGHEKTKEINCQLEPSDVHTVRVRSSRIWEIEADSDSDETSIGLARTWYARRRYRFTYEEQVRGIIESPPAGTRPVEQTASMHVARTAEVSTSFETTGLHVHLPHADHEGIIAVCETLRHVLPVHVGIEEDAVELLPALNGDLPQGFVIAELYPGGIGLVDAIYDDDQLLRQLFSHAGAWLQDCECSRTRTDGCPKCLHSWTAPATNRSRLPSRSAAVRVLQPFVPSSGRDGARRGNAIA